MSAGVAVAIAIARRRSRGAVTRRLFHGDGFMTAMLVVGVVGYGASYLVRGVLGGVRWFTGYAVVLLADAVGRLAVAAPLVFVASPHVAAAAVAAAGCSRGRRAVLLGAPLAARRSAGAARVSRSTRAAPLRFAAPAGVVAAADQLLINGAPLLVILLGHGRNERRPESSSPRRCSCARRSTSSRAWRRRFSRTSRSSGMQGARSSRAVLRRTVGSSRLAGSRSCWASAPRARQTMDILYGSGIRRDAASTSSCSGRASGSISRARPSSRPCSPSTAARASRWRGSPLRPRSSAPISPCRMNEVERVSIALVVGDRGQRRAARSLLAAPRPQPRPVTLTGRDGSGRGRKPDERFRSHRVRDLPEWSRFFLPLFTASRIV